MAYSAKELSKAYFLGYKVRKIINSRRLKKLVVSIKELPRDYQFAKGDIQGGESFHLR